MKLIKNYLNIIVILVTLVAEEVIEEEEEPEIVFDEDAVDKVTDYSWLTLKVS